MRHPLTASLVSMPAATIFFAALAFSQRQSRVPTPIETEINLGRQAASNLEARVNLVQDPVIAEFINRVGQNLVWNSDSKVPFTIRVIDSDEVNALALPGGFLFVSTGLILAADNESELAGVMAHLIGHVVSSHAIQQEREASSLYLATPVGTLAEAASIGVPVTFLRFGKRAADEADFLGLQYLYKAGYDPRAIASFSERLLRPQPPKISALFATHEQSEERINKIQQNIQNFLPVRAQSAGMSSEFQNIKIRVAELASRRTL